jgi:hypothetical protein
MQSFKGGDFALFPRSLVWEIFGSHAHPSRLGFGLWYGDTFSGDLALDDDEEIGGISIYQPGNNALRDLYRLARQVPSWIDWNGDCFAVAEAAFLADIPAWLFQNYVPTVVHSAEEFAECLATLRTSYIGDASGPKWDF